MPGTSCSTCRMPIHSTSTRWGRRDRYGWGYCYLLGCLGPHVPPTECPLSQHLHASGEETGWDGDTVTGEGTYTQYEQYGCRYRYAYSYMYPATVLAQVPLEKYWCMYSCTLYIVQERWCTDGCRKLYFCCLHISLSENPRKAEFPA